MERKDFEKITKKHIEVCKEIIKRKDCGMIECKDCPFTLKNISQPNNCGSNNEEIIKKAKDFIDLFENDFVKTQLEQIFKSVEVGDRVWDFLCGWGTISNINKELTFPITVIFEDKDFKWANYTFDGRTSYNQKTPILFYDEIKFDVPKKPFNLEKELKMLETKEFKNGENNYYFEWDPDDYLTFNNFKSYETIGCIYFKEKEQIKKIVQMTNEKKIKKEEFIKAYKNVFGEK